METITTKEQLKQNIRTFETYLNSQDTAVRDYTYELCKKGICFVAYKISGSWHFAPSRFLGYVNNSLEQHEKNNTKDGRVTNPAIDTILNKKPDSIQELEECYIDFCNKLGIVPNKTGAFGVARKYWQINL
jgi:hypothetical protein